MSSSGDLTSIESLGGSEMDWSLGKAFLTPDEVSLIWYFPDS
jgi:hypothetical protein